LNNINCKSILKMIFEYILNRRKLKIIKYNKQLSNKLDITLEDFENYKLLKEFVKNYNTDIKDIDIIDLPLFQKSLGNKGLKDLSEINFKELKKLNLIDNNISDIKILEKVKFNNIEELYLSRNKIKDIGILEKVNLKNLKILYLNENKISDITVFEKVIFSKLEELNLSWNEITDIKVLEKVNFRDLKILDLSDNDISDIIVFERVKFNKLEELNLSNNDIDKDNYTSLISNLNDKIEVFIIDDDDELDDVYYRYDCYKNVQYLELK